MEKSKKIRVSEIEIVVRGDITEPYYEIKYKEVGKDNYNVGYSSYFLKKVFKWKEENFEVIKDEVDDIDKVLSLIKDVDIAIITPMCKMCEKYQVCEHPFSTECKLLKDRVKKLLEGPKQEEEEIEEGMMDCMGTDIMQELLRVRKEFTDESILTVRGCVAIVDALFYLLAEKEIKRNN